MSKRLGYFCKNPDCREKGAFHHLIPETFFVPGRKLLFIDWPQRLVCPVSEKWYEYWEREIVLDPTARE